MKTALYSQDFSANKVQEMENHLTSVWTFLASEDGEKWLWDFAEEILSSKKYGSADMLAVLLDDKNRGDGNVSFDRIVDVWLAQMHDPLEDVYSPVSIFVFLRFKTNFESDKISVVCVAVVSRAVCLGVLFLCCSCSAYIVCAAVRAVTCH